MSHCKIKVHNVCALYPLICIKCITPKSTDIEIIVLFNVYDDTGNEKNVNHIHF